MPKTSKIRRLIPEGSPKMKHTPLGKLPPSTAVALLKLGEITTARQEKVVAEPVRGTVRAVVREGIGGAPEISILAGERRILRIEVDPDAFNDESVAWLCRL